MRMSLWFCLPPSLSELPSQPMNGNCHALAFRRSLGRWWPTVLTLLLLSGLVVIAPAAFGQEQITLRFIDAESGKPLKGIWVGIFAENVGQPVETKHGSVSTVIVKTDGTGQAVFRLPKQVPSRLGIEATGALHGCSGRVFSVEDVLRKGIEASYHYNALKPRWCPKLKAEASAKPGEIVIFDIPMTVWDRIRQENP
jgi:hypothetical protein